MKPYTFIPSFLLILHWRSERDLNPSTSRLQGERTAVVLSDQKERIAVLQTPFNYDYQSITTGSTGK